MARVALVLGAGGPVGHAYHAGVLAALADAGWDARHADLVVGTSIGAITAGLLRAGLGPVDLFRHAAGRPLSTEGATMVPPEWHLSRLSGLLGPRPRVRGAPASPALLRSLARNPRRLRSGLVMAAVAPVGTRDTAPFVEHFTRLLGPGWPAGATRIVAVDLGSGRRQVFGAPGAPDTTPAAAIAASCAVPSFFEPVTIAGRRYVDGGVISPANTDVVANRGAGPWDVVVASIPMGIGAWPGRVGVDLPGRLINRLSAVRGLRRVAGTGASAVIFEPGPSELGVMHYDAFDLTHLPEIADRAYQATGRRLAGDPAIAVLLTRLRDQPGRPRVPTAAGDPGSA